MGKAEDAASRMRVNRRRWDELVAIHAAARSYDLDGFKRGKPALDPVVLKEVGPVDGKSMLHLQCHFGLDTLAWARRGAKVTGVDYSPEAIALARSLADELEIKARFIQANVYSLPPGLKRK